MAERVDGAIIRGMDSDEKDQDPATAMAIMLLDMGYKVEEIDWPSISAVRRYLNEPIIPVKYLGMTLDGEPPPSL